MNADGEYSIPRRCFYCPDLFVGRNDFWEHVYEGHLAEHEGQTDLEFVAVSAPGSRRLLKAIGRMGDFIEGGA